MQGPQFTKSKSSTAAALLSLLVIDGVQGQANNTQVLSRFPPCDALIAANLSHAVHFPSSPLYPTLVNGSWTLDTQRSPWCFVVPSTTAEVSQAVTALRTANNGAGDWHIAIRSGGHGSDNQNSLANGVIIDLTHLNVTTYDAATNLASVNTGALWGSVYAELEESGVVVTGGREAVVGVGGLTLGGGISWYTPRMGFACDSVVNYEVVLASGEIVNANASSNSDLWRALKGGSSNFGIVTRFDFEAFPATNITRARRFMSPEHSEEYIRAFSAFADLDESHHANAILAPITYSPVDQNITMELTEINTLNDMNTTAFDDFHSIPLVRHEPRESMSYYQSATSTHTPRGLRSVGGGMMTFANDPRVMRFCFEEFYSLVADLTESLGPEYFSSIIEFQAFPSYIADIGVRNGGNMLGLDPASRNKLLFVAGVTLVMPNPEAYFPQTYERVMALYQRVEDFAKSVGSHEDFVYMPYADAYQNVIGNYGAENVNHIRQVAKKYDPCGFFQRRVPGGWKISRV